MPSRQAVLAERYRDALIDVRNRVSTRVDRTWRDLGSWDEADVARFQSRVLPVVQAGQRRTVALTDAYLARATRTRPVGLVADDLIGAAVRNGTDPADVYRRPFVQLWSALSNGARFMDAMNAAGVRAAQSASTDVSLTMRASADAFDAQAADEARIVGWERVLDPDACAYCATASTQRYRSANLDPIHANCVVGSTVVESSSARNATRRRYCGEMIVIRTALGYELTITPNHPVLTDKGWVSAGLLNKGDRVVSGSTRKRVGLGVPNEQHDPSRIEDRFAAGQVMSLVTVPFSAEDFHGDRGDGQVDVVPADGLLRHRLQVGQHSQHQGFSRRPHNSSGLAGLCRFHQSALRHGLSTNGGVGGSGVPLSFLNGHALRSDLLGLAVTPNALDASLYELATQYAPVHAESSGDGLLAFSGDVSVNGLLVGGQPPTPAGDASPLEFSPDGRLADADNGRGLAESLSGDVQSDSIVQLDRVSGSHWVYNLRTDDGWYWANNILVHNCQCGIAPVFAENDRAIKDFNRQVLSNIKDANAGADRPYWEARHFRVDGQTGEVILPEVAVHEHGELGAVLADASHTFSGPGDIPG